jgi:ADP-ribose diphosphatase
MVRKISEREVFKTDIFSVKEIELELRNKKKARYSIIEKKDSSLIVPITEDGQLILIKEYFAAIGSYEIGLPKGRVDSGNPLDAANRELQEETGYKAKELVKLGTLTVTPGTTRHKTHVYLARKLIESKLPHDEDEEIEVIKIPFKDFEGLIENNKLNEARFIAALYMARKYLMKKS